jgi:hypothetical protein
MEKLIKNKKNLLIASLIISVIFLLAFYISINNNIKNEKYFDILLADLYNNEENSQASRFSFLSNLDDPNISFFGDLHLASINNLEKYEKLDKDLIILKKTILENNLDALRSLSLDEEYTFKEIVKIFYLNSDLTNYYELYKDGSEEINNFFLKAVSRYNNEIN